MMKDLIAWCEYISFLRPPAGRLTPAARPATAACLAVGLLLGAGCTRAKKDGLGPDTSSGSSTSTTEATSSTDSSSGSSSSTTSTSTTDDTADATSDTGDTATTSSTTSGGEGGSGRPKNCPSIWRNCPPMDTELEPLHELGNSDGGLLLVHGAFWLQGHEIVREPDGSLGPSYVGALRIPYERGSIPRVLEGNVTIGTFREYQGRIYHPDFDFGEAITVFTPEGDLIHKLEIPTPRAGSGLLMSPVFKGNTMAVTDASCLNVYFIDINDWSLRKLEIEGDYLGGSTSLTYVGDDLYCMGDGYIFKINPLVPNVLAEWRTPELETGHHDFHYSWLWDTPQGLLTWRRSLKAGDESRFELLDPGTLARTDYFRPAAGQTDHYLVGSPRYAAAENIVYYYHQISGGITLGLFRFQVESKTVAQVVPAERPWGGAWDVLSELTMDDKYYYWIENWQPSGAPGLDSGEYIVRYPRKPVEQ